METLTLGKFIRNSIEQGSIHGYFQVDEKYGHFFIPEII